MYVWRFAIYVRPWRDSSAMNVLYILCLLVLGPVPLPHRDPKPKGCRSPMGTITALETRDVRFPTSRHLDGSDAMNPDPDYSASYVTLRTDEVLANGEPLAGYGFVFTIGRGNDVQTAAVAALAEYVQGLSVDDVCSDLGLVSRLLTNDSQLRWLGPEKGVIHMAV